jgi:hypothetical protein
MIQVKTKVDPYMTNDPRSKPSAYPPPESKYESRNPHNSPSSSRVDFNQRQYRPRSRSRSPYRRSQNDSYPSASSSRYDYHSRRSPPRSKDSYSGDAKYNQRDHAVARGPEAFAPVYVVDVQQLFKKLMQTEVGTETIAAMARQLMLTKERGCCAGNEAV